MAQDKFLYPFNIEDFGNPDWFKNNFNLSMGVACQNHVRDLKNNGAALYGVDKLDIRGEYYNTAAGINSSVNVDKTTAIFDTNKYKPFEETVLVIIESTSISSHADFEINDCKIKEIGSGKFVLFCDVGTDAEKRSKIYDTLFYGTDGSDPRASPTYITSISALKTTTSRDVGCNMHYIKCNGPVANMSASDFCTGVMSNTTDNNVVSTWSNIQWRNLTGSFEIGTDREADETSNPAVIEFLGISSGLGFYSPAATLLNSNAGSATVTNIGEAVIIAKGTISWSIGGDGVTSFSDIDFNVDNGIPAFTQALASEVDSIITHDIDADSTPSDIISIFAKNIVADIQGDDEINVKVKNSSDDSLYHPDGEVNQFAEFGSEATEFIIQLVQDGVSPVSGSPATHGYGKLLR